MGSGHPVGKEDRAIRAHMSTVPLPQSFGFVLVAALVLLQPARAVSRQDLPRLTDSLKLAVIGDSGNGRRAQDQVAAQMIAVRKRFPFELVLMVGDNLLGRQAAADFVTKFERPYAPLLSSDVQFFAALGNHDEPTTRYYPPFNMGGQRYYTYARQRVRFFVLDSTDFDPAQEAWIENALKAAAEEWKVCYLHHPLYSSGSRHGSAVDLRARLEPLFVEHGVQVVFSGHDHVYERIKPQNGIHYFVVGSSGQLRQGGVRPSPMTAAYFDRDQVFMVAEIAGQELSFEAITRVGETVDSGVIRIGTPSVGEHP